MSCADCPTCSTDRVRVLHGKAPCPESGERHLKVVLPEPVQKVAAWVPVTRELLADIARTWQERAVILRSADPNPFPFFHLFRSPRRSKR